MIVIIFYFNSWPLAMPDIPRYLDLRETLQARSCFLFGPRQTGKTTLIRQNFSEHKVYNLLDQSLFVRLSRNPALIRQELEATDQIVVIDEIQKMPVLLNEVQLMIEEHGTRFLMTGSSARSLRKKGTNLLGGRARSRNLHPLIRRELADQFDLQRALQFGLLPSIYFSESPIEDLEAYTGAYLTEEIAAEAIVRNLSAFSRFLQVAALCHGQMLNFSQVANDAQVAVTTVREYFQILKDTLLAHELPAFNETRKRKAISTSKYYLFDIGVARYLQGRRDLPEKTAEYGEAFETYIFQELKAFADYHQITNLHYWRSKSQFEVDFILDLRVAIEVKAKANVTAKDLRGLKALREEGLFDRYIVVTMEDRARWVDEIELLPWADFLDQLWNRDL
jgi:predicted AAA+ superfamily ATPase